MQLSVKRVSDYRIIFNKAIVESHLNANDECKHKNRKNSDGDYSAQDYTDDRKCVTCRGRAVKCARNALVLLGIAKTDYAENDREERQAYEVENKAEYAPNENIGQLLRSDIRLILLILIAGIIRLLVLLFRRLLILLFRRLLGFCKRRTTVLAEFRTVGIEIATFSAKHKIPPSNLLYCNYTIQKIISQLIKKRQKDFLIKIVCF